MPVFQPAPYDIVQSRSAKTTPPELTVRLIGRSEDASIIYSRDGGTIFVLDAAAFSKLPVDTVNRLSKGDAVTISRAENGYDYVACINDSLAQER